MHLEHVNLVVSDIDESLRFYQAAFPTWTVRGGGKDDWNGKPRNWIHFGDERQYIAFSDHGEGENRDLAGHSIGLAHFAYVTDDMLAVINNLTKAGFNVDTQRTEEGRRRNAYFIDPDGFEIEFIEYFSDDNTVRNCYDVAC